MHARSAESVILVCVRQREGKVWERTCRKAGWVGLGSSSHHILLALCCCGWNLGDPLFLTGWTGRMNQCWKKSFWDLGSSLILCFCMLNGRKQKYTEFEDSVPVREPFWESAFLRASLPESPPEFQRMPYNFSFYITTSPRLWPRRVSCISRRYTSHWGYSSVVEHLTADQEVPGSNPGAPFP